jgi:hypothetical protein
MLLGAPRIIEILRDLPFSADRFFVIEMVQALRDLRE